MSFHQTSFCFVCSHLASGEEGDELRRNSDVIEILKNTQFPKICKTPGQRIPEKILEYDRIIWLGDLNYRIALNYAETRRLVEDNDWSALFEKDQRELDGVVRGQWCTGPLENQRRKEDPCWRWGDINSVEPGPYGEKFRAMVLDLVVAERLRLMQCKVH